MLHSGELYAAASAVLWAVAVIYFRKGGDLVPPVVLNLFKNTVGLVLLVLSMLAIGAPLFPAERTAADYLVLLGSGAFGIALADTLFFASLNRLGAGRSAIVDCLYSPLVIGCAFVYLREPVGGTMIAAVILIGSAIFIGTWEPALDAPPLARRELLLGIGYGVLSMVLMASAIVVAKPVIETSELWWATTVRMVGAIPILALLAGSRRYRPAVRRAFT
ncbi:MAG: DMT family transporter, partial [Deltaproteobacteria bacterium]|nr:DMT family transporter [Deltaproteobacteria bacterium]